MATGSVFEALSAAGGAAGLVALLGSAFGYGRIVQRLTTVEKEVEKLSSLSETVARIDERVLSVAEGIKDIKQQLETVTRAQTDAARVERTTRRAS